MLERSVSVYEILSLRGCSYLISIKLSLFGNLLDYNQETKTIIVLCVCVTERGGGREGEWKRDLNKK